MTINRLVQFGVAHTASADLGWWVSAVNILAEHREAELPRYEVFRVLVSEFIETDKSVPFGFALRGLNDAQKWLLLIAIDEYLDQDLVSPVTFKVWLKGWKQATQLCMAGYAAIESKEVELDYIRLGEAWNSLLTAASR